MSIVATCSTRAYYDDLAAESAGSYALHLRRALDTLDGTNQAKDRDTVVRAKPLRTIFLGREIAMPDRDQIAVTIHWDRGPVLAKNKFAWLQAAILIGIAGR